MDWPIVMLGVLLGLILAAKEIGHNIERGQAQRSDAQRGSDSQGGRQTVPTRPQPAPTTPAAFGRLDDSVAGILREAAREADIRRGISRPPTHAQVAREIVNGKNLVEDWRKSILGLIKLAETNLQFGKSQAAIMNHKVAVEAAVTSVENISRALLHCFAEKPDLDSGQEEPLRLLARRLQGEERAQFEKAVDEAAQLYRNKIVQAYLSEKNIEAPILDAARTQQILEAAAWVVTQFRQIMDEHFATEIPELRERCPSCRAVSISLWTFNSQEATYHCYVCGHKWIQPTH